MAHISFSNQFSLVAIKHIFRIRSNNASMQFYNFYLANFGRSLWAEAAGNSDVGEAFNLGLAFLHNNQVHGRQVRADNAAANRLALLRTLLFRIEHSRCAIQQQPNTVVREDALLHGETLLVISARDAEDVAGELRAKEGTINLRCHAKIVKASELALILDLDAFLAAGNRVRDVDLHGD